MSKSKPYKTICVSLYLEDDDRLVELVASLKAQGVTGANKSKVIRWALRELQTLLRKKQIDLESIENKK